MVHFSCSCLNVRVHGRGATPPLQDVTDVYLSQETAADSFFSPDTLVVTMDICGVTKAQNLLCKERAVDGWIITTCICCKFDMCATHADELHRVLVNSTAKQDDAINVLMQSNRYSRLFQMVLPDINDNFIQNNFVGVELQNSNLDSSVQHIQKLVTNYLKNEQKEMEERIRKFSEAQQASYTDLLQKIRKQKQSIIYLLMKAKENQASNHNDGVAESPLKLAAKDDKDSCDERGEKSMFTEIHLSIPANKSSTSTDSAFDRSDTSLSYGRTARKSSGRTLRRTLSTPARSDKVKKGPRRPLVNVDVGGVFDMEEFDSKEEYSDEDSEGSENSNAEDANNEKSKDQMMCATSLPMSIPAFSHYSHISIMDEEEEDFKVPLPKNPEEIAASIRALACSVTDGTEMFGELPRRRLNTGDLLSSRPL